MFPSTQDLLEASFEDYRRITTMTAAGQLAIMVGGNNRFRRTATLAGFLVSNGLEFLYRYINYGHGDFMGVMDFFPLAIVQCTFNFCRACAWSMTMNSEDWEKRHNTLLELFHNAKEDEQLWREKHQNLWLTHYRKLPTEKYGLPQLVASLAPIFFTKAAQIVNRRQPGQAAQIANMGHQLQLMGAVGAAGAAGAAAAMGGAMGGAMGAMGGAMGAAGGAMGAMGAMGGAQANQNMVMQMGVQLGQGIALGMQLAQQEAQQQQQPHEQVILQAIQHSFDFLERILLEAKYSEVWVATALTSAWITGDIAMHAGETRPYEQELEKNKRSFEYWSNSTTEEL